MALRLSVTLGRSPESWLAMQNNYIAWYNAGERHDEVSGRMIDLGKLVRVQG